MATREATAPPSAGDAPADRAGRLVELTPAARRLRAALGFLRLPPTEPELQVLHRWLDTWAGARTLVLEGEVAIFHNELRSRFDWLREPDRSSTTSA
jgi:hypothetical protein